MVQDARHVTLGDAREVVRATLLARGVEHVLAALVEERLVQEHRAPRLVRHGLGHEARVDTGVVGLQANDVLGRHDGVGHGERLGMAQRNAVLRAAGAVIGVLNGHGHLLEHEHHGTAQVARGVIGREVEVAGLVHGHGLILAREVVELQVGAHVHDEPALLGLVEHDTQTFAGIPREGLAVGRADVAEHARHAVVARAPGKHLEGGGVGEGEHIGLIGRGKALDRGAIEADALLKGNLEVLGRDGEALEPAQHVGEPQAHKADAALLYRANNEVDVLLLIHTRPFPAEALQSPLSHTIVTEVFPTHRTQERPLTAPLGQP